MNPRFRRLLLWTALVLWGAFAFREYLHQILGNIKKVCVSIIPEGYISCIVWGLNVNCQGEWYITTIFFKHEN